MEFKKFYQKYMRMCKSYENCEGCPRIGKGCLEFDMDVYAIGELENDVERWAEEHPQKTRLQDLLEKYPSVKLNISGYPILCCQTLGYCDECSYGRDWRKSCKDCRNMPVEEDE